MALPGGVAAWDRIAARVKFAYPRDGSRPAPAGPTKRRDRMSRPTQGTLRHVELSVPAVGAVPEPEDCLDPGLVCFFPAARRGVRGGEA